MARTKKAGKAARAVRAIKAAEVAKAAMRKKYKFPTAYDLWKNENIAKLRANSNAKYPTREDLAFPAIYKDIWDQLEDKSIWQEGEVAAKKRHEAQIEASRSPDWPMSAYYIWCKEFMKKENSVFNVEFEKKAKILWNELEDKSEWKKKAIEDEIRYEYELSIWKPLKRHSKPCAYRIWYNKNKFELRLQARKIHNAALVEFQENAKKLWIGIEDKSEWEIKAAQTKFQQAKLITN